ncbi:hypothetical protein NM688_g8364 [Phlebia brevispora]|uniref:Uncharacterized protein n=1 Tax=Phlebia brevispora TaxID=194682 RepID=A0ACC1RTI5_9APHY|nr:hypothetical protein NM688_g8364 [Phlebia brevispora]
MSDAKSHDDSVGEKGSDVHDNVQEINGSEIDLLEYHEHNAGRLVVDPEEARIEFGEAVAKKLKLSKDGTKVLWPQPADDPLDPQNWSDFQKNLQLFIVTLAAIVPDFDSGIGIASIFALAQQFDTTTGVINNMTSNWSIFLLGKYLTFSSESPASDSAPRLGRHLRCDAYETIRPPTGPVLVARFLVGCTFAPNLKTFTAMRCLNGFFATCPQVTGLYIVTDLFPFHLQARKLNIWTMGFIISPFLSPFAFGFLVARTTWRWAYGIGSMYGAAVLILIVTLSKETLYDRKLPDPRPMPLPSNPIRARIETLIGITGVRMAKYRSTWKEVTFIWFELIWRPHLLAILCFEGVLFGFSIGINVTNAVFLQLPIPLGYQFGQFATAGAYATPIVAVLIGETLGRYLNDYIMNVSIRRNKGVFEAESRLWTCYLAVSLYIIGFVVLGASFQNHLSVGALVMGWGIAEVATMVNTVAVYAYVNDCFPRLQGEISALVNLFRTLGGFAVAYFQVIWATKNGAIQTFGCEAAIVTGLFILIVPALQLTGRTLRVRSASELGQATTNIEFNIELNTETLLVVVGDVAEV